MHAVFEALSRNAAATPQGVAFRDDATQITWAGLAAKVTRLAAVLKDAPDVVAIALTGGADWWR
ncbi:hypothetical protein PEL8287_03613 [Roseovarius litorisediminis]|uniref:AMP-binding enzyme n=1 Tax=Roseovarius litorisediminis TaxID=1312363 RepID=A0A1Y5TMQ6_9RHOB|nr:hypothetical protein [Roseovarius litorisediminis]SLN65590.1 hypothetical protein PEL8287_03613 [Roseovarius litorisediminis]